MSPYGDISETDFNAWKHHPVSKVVLQYLADYSEQLSKTHLSEWLAGKTDPVRDLEIRGRVLAVVDVTELTFASIVNFYPEQEGNDEKRNAS